MASLEPKTCEKVSNVSDKKCEVLVRADIVRVQPSGARRLLNVDDCPVHSLYNLFTGLLHFWPYFMPVFDVWERDSTLRNPIFFFSASFHVID